MAIAACSPLAASNNLAPQQILPEAILCVFFIALAICPRQNPNSAAQNPQSKQK
jgi:hypothetical protein